MRLARVLPTIALCLLPFLLPAQDATYLGFDRNSYPGDSNLKALRQTFSYSGYWLNHPPGERTNTWAGIALPSSRLVLDFWSSLMDGFTPN